MKYLNVKDVLLLHSMLIDETGGSHGLRDLGLLESAVARPLSSFGGVDLYEDIYDKSAALFHSLLFNHAFIDGNKRTSFFAMMTFLELNEKRFVAEQNEIVEYALLVEREHLDIEQISKWIGEHVEGSK